MSAGVLSGPRSSRHKDCVNELSWWFLWSLHQVVHVQFAGFCGKGQLLFSVIPSQKGRRKLEMLVWRGVVRYWRKREKLRIQSSLRVYNKNLRMWLTESDNHKCVLQFLLKQFFSSRVPQISWGSCICQEVSFLTHLGRLLGTLFYRGLYGLHKVTLTSLKLSGHIWVYAHYSQIWPASQSLGNVTVVNLCR